MMTLTTAINVSKILTTTNKTAGQQFDVFFHLNEKKEEKKKGRGGAGEDGRGGREEGREGGRNE